MSTAKKYLGRSNLNTQRRVLDIQATQESTTNKLSSFIQKRECFVGLLLNNKQEELKQNITPSKNHSRSNQVKALVCISTRSKVENVIKDLQKVKGVSEIYSSIGQYNVIAVAQADSLPKLPKKVMQKIREIRTINSMLTLTII